MNAEIFAQWLSESGYRIRKTASSYWVENGPRAYQAFPYHWIIAPSEDELMEFMEQEKIIGIRYSAPLSADKGALSYHAVYEGGAYDLENLGKWARKNVRRGLANCAVEQLSFDALAEDGWLLQLDTLERQGRRLNLKTEHTFWRNRCLAAKKLNGFEAWGALVNGQLAASVITFRMEDCYYMLYQQCARAYLAEHVNNALSFVVTRNLSLRPETKSILYGIHSLDAPDSVDEFKFRMGYHARAVRQRVVFHSTLAPFFNSLSYSIVRGCSKLFPHNSMLAKAEGMLRFYLQGALLLSEQPPLDVLSRA